MAAAIQRLVGRVRERGQFSAVPDERIGREHAGPPGIGQDLRRGPAGRGCFGGPPPCRTARRRSSPHNRARLARVSRFSANAGRSRGAGETDALIANGGELAALSQATLNGLNALLPPAWSHDDPIDILGDASPDRYAKAVSIAIADEQSDGLVVYAPSKASPIRPAPRSHEGGGVARAEAGARELDGRRAVDAGHTVLDAAGYPNVSLSRHGRPHFHAHVAVHLQPPRVSRRPLWALNRHNAARPPE